MYLDDGHVNLVLKMLALSIMPMLDKYKLKQVFQNDMYFFGILIQEVPKN